MREANKNVRTTVQEQQTLVVSSGTQKPQNQPHNHKGCMKKTLTESKFKYSLEFTQRHWIYDWNRVLWSDETKIELFGHVHHRHVCRQKRDAYKQKHLTPTVKYGHGTLMLWSCFAASGPGPLC